MLKNVFVSIKPLHVSVFFYDHPQGVLGSALCRYYSSRWFAFVEFVLLRSMWPHVYVICVCLVFLSVGVCWRWSWKTTEICRGFILTNTFFNILLVLNVEVIVFWSVNSAWVGLYNNLHRTSKLLNFHTVLYTVTQKAVKLNTCRTVRKFLTEQWKVLLASQTWNVLWTKWTASIQFSRITVIA